MAAAVTALLALLALPRRLRYAGRALRQWLRPAPPTPVSAGYRRTLFGRLIHLIAGNPVMPILVFGAVFVLVGTVFMFYTTHNNGSQFFVESEPENAIVYVRARGNLSIDQKASTAPRRSSLPIPMSAAPLPLPGMAGSTTTPAAHSPRATPSGRFSSKCSNGKTARR